MDVTPLEIPPVGLVLKVRSERITVREVRAYFVIGCRMADTAPGSRSYHVDLANLNIPLPWIGTPVGIFPEGMSSAEGI